MLFIKIRTNDAAMSAVNHYSGFVTTLTSRATSTDNRCSGYSYCAYTRTRTTHSCGAHAHTNVDT